MNRRVLILLLIIITSMLCVMYSGERVFIWIISLCLSYYGLAWLNIFYTLNYLRVSQSVSHKEIPSGSYGTLTIILSNTGRFPLAHLDFWYDSYETQFHGGLEDNELLEFAIFGYAPSVMPWETRSYKVDVFFPYRGYFQPGIIKAELRDIFGLCQFTLYSEAFSDRQPITVLPLTSSLSLGDFVESALTGVASGGRGEQEPYSVADIRLFRAGDPFKWVHWKLTARTRELQVREFDAVHASRTALFIDLSYHGLKGESASALEDCACRSAATISEALLSYNIPTGIVCYTDKRLEISGNTLDDLLLFRRFLAGLSFTSSYRFGDILRHELSSHGETSHITVITSNPTAMLTDNLASISAHGHNVLLIVVSKDMLNEDPALLLEDKIITERSEGRGFSTQARFTVITITPRIRRAPVIADGGRSASASASASASPSSAGSASPGRYSGAAKPAKEATLAK